MCVIGVYVVFFYHLYIALWLFLSFMGDVSEIGFFWFGASVLSVAFRSFHCYVCFRRRT